jgi:hypothetical protein
MGKYIIWREFCSLFEINYDFKTQRMHIKHAATNFKSKTVPKFALRQKSSRKPSPRRPTARKIRCE